MKVPAGDQNREAAFQTNLGRGQGDVQLTATAPSTTGDLLRALSAAKSVPISVPPKNPSVRSWLRHGTWSPEFSPRIRGVQGLSD